MRIYFTLIRYVTGITRVNDLAYNEVIVLVCLEDANRLITVVVVPQLPLRYLYFYYDKM